MKVCIYLICLWCACMLLPYGCKSDHPDDRKTYEFFLKDSLVLPSKNNIPVRTICVKYFDSAKEEFLLWSNRDRSQIEVFNLTQGNHERSIKIPREGPGDISYDRGGAFSIINLDTILVSSTRSPGKLYVIDTSGLFYDVIDYSDSTDYSTNKFSTQASRSAGNVYRYDNSRIVIPLRIPGYKNRIPSRTTIDSLTQFKIFDLRSRTISKSPIKIDYNIYKVPRVHKFTTNARLRSRIYYGYANSPVIHYTDDLIKKIGVDVPSEHHQEYISYLKYPSPYETWKHMFHYMSLFSDPYRSLIYRVVKLPMADPEQHDGVDELNTIWDRASIMVLDPDLNLLGEFVLPVHGRYSWSECFVGRKGFYLLRSPNHPNYSESKITYDIAGWRERF